MTLKELLDESLVKSRFAELKSASAQLESVKRYARAAGIALLAMKTFTWMFGAAGVL
ncbi:MAG: hypothetical protein ACE5H4_08280 [Candidatus Thorarchaeota archaeon]